MYIYTSVLVETGGEMLVAILSLMQSYKRVDVFGILTRKAGRKCRREDGESRR
jgi:hypothetical protein